MTLATAHRGTELIERDHEIFRSLAARLQTALSRGNEMAIADRKAELLAFLDTHIEFENRVMRDHNYPISFTHAEEHVAFRAEVAKVLAAAGAAVPVSEIAGRLRKSHDRHLKYHDAVLCHYLNDRYALTIVDGGLGI